MLGVLGDSADHGRELELRSARQEALDATDAHLLRSLRLDDVLQALAEVAVKVPHADAFGISSTRSREFTDSERQLVLALAQKAGLAIENARLYEEAQARLREVEALAAENARLREEAERRAIASEALNHADERLYRSLRSDDVLDALLDVAKTILRAETSGVWAIDRARGALAVQAARGTGARFTEELGQLALLEAPLVKAVLDTSVVALENLMEDPRVGDEFRDLTRREGIQAAMCAPITVDDQVYGIFGVGFRAPRAFSDDEQQLVIALSQRAGLAIKNARLYEQAQHVATLEERQRLARELHDAVTQTLFSSALIADVLPELWEIDRVDGHRRLEQLSRLTRGALAEMRTLLLELRPGALAELPLPELLQQLADATSGRSMIQVTVSIEGRRRTPPPPDVHLAVYRMAQEALNNIVKHARARRASVALRYVRRGLVLSVEDDGIGFEPRRIPAGHLGIGIMRERAHGIGARLSIRSARGKGSCLQVRWTT